MKEITRRLYTKPVMLSLAFLAAAVLLVGLFVTTNSRAAVTVIPHGNDEFETLDNGETYHNFTGNQIPQGFFNFDGQSTSNSYQGVVPLKGDPPVGTEIDTVISRNNDVTVPGTTSLTMTALSLVSSSTITVTYSDRPPEAWTVHVGLSDFQSSTGSMTINSGGTFDSSLKVWPKFTFTRVSDQAQKFLDTGSGSGLMASAFAADTAEISPQPAPTVAPCKAVAVEDIAVNAQVATIGEVSDAAATGCPPVTLTSTNSPWQICNGQFCIPRPITEQELLASHNASPPGTRKKIAAQVNGAVLK